MATDSPSILDALKAMAPLMVGLDFIRSTSYTGAPAPIDQDCLPCRDWCDACWVLLSAKDYDELKRHLEGGE